MVSNDKGSGSDSASSTNSLLHNPYIAWHYFESYNYIFGLPISRPTHLCQICPINDLCLLFSSTPPLPGPAAPASNADEYTAGSPDAWRYSALSRTPYAHSLAGSPTCCQNSVTESPLAYVPHTLCCTK